MKLGLEIWTIGYGAWLLAGTADFLCHRRTDLSHTSGLPESALHVAQVALIGCGVILTLLFQMSPAVAAALAVLVAAHAVAGYLDTRSAYGRRDIRPIEQHLHSVLDTAPAFALVAVVAATWPAAGQTGWTWDLRQPALSVLVWASVLLPAVVLCAVPALLEFGAALAARRARHNG